MRWGDETLTSKVAIDRLFKDGVVIHGRPILLIYRRTEPGSRRVVFVASRKVGKAVQRNRAKRLMREAYRTLVERMAQEPVHLAWIARAACPSGRMQDIHAEMTILLARARLLRSAEAEQDGDAQPPGDTGA